MPVEWRGGKLVIIVDEGLLNIDDYSEFRQYVKTHFYIKAVISLTSDTFVPVSKTLTKTSVLFLIKKTDVHAVQQEPIFFAYVDKVGLNTKRKVCDNHLFDEMKKSTVIEHYENFRRNVLSAYSGNSFHASKLTSTIPFGTSTTIQKDSFYYIRNFHEIEDRLDFRYYDPRFDEIKKYMQSSQVKSMRDIIIPDGVSYGLTASGRENKLDSDIKFINIENLTESGIIDQSNIRYVGEEESEKQLIVSINDLLISRSRLIGLSSIITDAENNCTYGSYIIRFKLNTEEVEPLFIAKFINSTRGRLQTELLKTGAVGENINSEQLLKVVIPKIRKTEQIEILKRMARYEEEAEKTRRIAQEQKTKALKIMEGI